MKEKIRGILLQSVRHNDRHNIITLYTESRGRVSFLSSASTGRAGKMRKSLLAPLAVVESDINFSPTRELQYLGAVHVPHIWHSLYFEPDKISMTFFLSDFLSSLLRKAPEDAMLFRYLVEAVDELDRSERSVVNYHLCFLLRLLHFMGVEPDFSTYGSGRIFDMRDGVFREPEEVAHHDIIPVDYAAYMPRLGRMTFATMHRFRFSGEQRRLILNYLMRYYSIHLSIPPTLKSLDILHDLYC